MQQLESNLKTHYQVERILDIKHQQGEKFCLIKWVGWDASYATWEKEETVRQFKSLFKEYYASRKYDEKCNAALKQAEFIEMGSNPYQQTRFHGHYLYGDQPIKIIALKVIENKQGKSVFAEIQWRVRNDGTILCNSLIDTREVIEHDPDFLLQFYQSRVELSYEQPTKKPKVK